MDSELNQQSFLGFDSLMKSVAVSSSEHQTPCEFVYDNDFTVAHRRSRHRAVHQVSRSQRLHCTWWFISIFSGSEKLSSIEVAFRTWQRLSSGKRNRSCPFRPSQSPSSITECRLANSVGHRCTYRWILSPCPEMISGVLASSTRMESTSSTMAKLRARAASNFLFIYNHVVAQVVETELVVGAVCYVGHIGIFSLLL